MQVAVFGAGYVGLVTGACFADLGHEVVVRDIVAEQIEALRAGRVADPRDGLDELLERNSERLHFTTDVTEAVDGADVVYIAVGTPPTYSGDADLSAVWTVVDELPQIDRRIVVAMKSTVPVGTGRRSGIGSTTAASTTWATSRTPSSRPRARRSRTSCIRTASSSAHSTSPTADVVAKLHERHRRPVVRCDVASAEMIKLAANAALVTRISFINEIANVCEATGADVTTVSPGHRPRPPHRPGSFVLESDSAAVASRRTRSRSSSSRRTRATTSSS